MDGIEREAIDVEHHRPTRRVLHDDSKNGVPGCSVLMHTDPAAARRRSASACRRQHEELVRGDDQVVHRVIGAVRQIVDHELAVATGQHQASTKCSAISLMKTLPRPLTNTRHIGGHSTSGR